MMNHLESSNGAPPSALHDFDIRVRRYRPRVLVAEDDEDLRVLLQCWLDFDGYRVTSVATGLDLVEYLGADAEDRPSVVISDDRLPGVRGLRAFEYARESGLTLPFVLMTAFGSDELAAEAAQIDVTVINKPFEIDDLRTLVRWLAPRIDIVCVACGSPDDVHVVVTRGDAMFCRECRALIATFERT